jgi:2-amino-4-hydroxy-6-hydroxymethyldihydropteridine diphosphokinase
VSGSIHPLVEAAAAGALPAWSQAGAKRTAHVQRVAALLDAWAAALDLDDTDRKRWRAAGILHDALHDAPHDSLRETLAGSMRELPGKMLHGPACVVRLRGEGVRDDDLLHAIEYHTIGHPHFSTLGRALYAADYLEPGRPQEQDERAALRSRMPADMDAVVPAILKARLLDMIRTGRSVRPETFEFWNSVPDARRA